MQVFLLTPSFFPWALCVFATKKACSRPLLTTAVNSSNIFTTLHQYTHKKKKNSVCVCVCARVCCVHTLLA